MNSASTIKDTVQSILEQKYAGELEYIIVDGGSTDGTLDIVSEFQQHITRVVSEPDDGISDAFNKGIGIATGDIIGMINSDDRLLPGVLQKIADYFDANNEVEVVHADLELYDGDRFVKILKPPRYWWIPWRMILFNHPTTFVRREVYRTCGLFDTSYRFSHMDFELFLRWVKAGIVIHYLPETLVRMQAGGASGRHIYKGFRENIRALRSHGYPMAPAYMQFFTKHLVQGLLCITKYICEYQHSYEEEKRKQR